MHGETIKIHEGCLEDLLRGTELENGGFLKLNLQVGLLCCH